LIALLVVIPAPLCHSCESRNPENNKEFWIPHQVRNDREKNDKEILW